jgi:hypothetical protein
MLCVFCLTFIQSLKTSISSEVAGRGERGEGRGERGVGRGERGEGRGERGGRGEGRRRKARRSHA